MCAGAKKRLKHDFIVLVFFYFIFQPNQTFAKRATEMPSWAFWGFGK